MKLHWNFLFVAMPAAIVLVGAGCSGINTGTSVSPASFFLPGLLKNDVNTNAPPMRPQTSTEFAFVK